MFTVWAVFTVLSVVYAIDNYQGRCGTISVMGRGADCTFIRYYFGFDNLPLLVIHTLFAIFTILWVAILGLKRLRLLRKR